MPLTGQEKTDYQRVYMRARRPSKDLQKAGLAVGQILRGKSGRPYELTDSQDEIARAALVIALRSNKLDVNTVVSKVVEKLEATKTVGIGGDATIVEDNDAQLRAVDAGIKLLERAEHIPGVRGDRAVSGAQITVNVLMMGNDGE